jgi:hypothetical protein
VVGGRPAQADDADALIGGFVALLPGFEQVIEDGVEFLFGRVPGLVEVVVNLGGVDGADGGFGVRVGGEQDAFGLRIEHHGLLQEVDAGQAGHALVGEEERDGVLSLQQLPADIERRLAGGSAKDAIVLAVVGAQVLHDGFKNAGVVVDGEKNGLRHRFLGLLF